jgi:hypothetical protein
VPNGAITLPISPYLGVQVVKKRPPAIWHYQELGSFLHERVNMWDKNINSALLIILILTSCTPAVTVISPTETAISLPTFTSIPPAATITPTQVRETIIPTTKPADSLSAVGPWLVYRHNTLSLGYADIGPTPEEFVLLNQNGSGRVLITLPTCNDQVNSFLMNGDNSANYLAKLGGDIYIFRPSQATGLLVYRQLWFSYCHTYFSGDETGGLLASFYQASKDVSPELILYELPSGKIRERFPLVRCSDNTNLCEKFRSNWSEMMRQQAQWSPNGRYLAFVAILDAASSDLFVYDAQNGSLRRLTDGPDWVGPIEWSPDGTQIIMQELLNDNENEFLFDPSSKPPSSVWSVSVSTSEIKMLYSTGDAYTIQQILLWLDDQRFITYEGWLVNADQARDLRLVDTKTGTNNILFHGVFVMISFDPVHEVFVLYEQNTENCLPSSICLVSMKDGTIRTVTDIPDYYLSFPDWDENTGLFVSSSDCPNDPQSFQSFNYQGTFRCIPKLSLTSVPLETVSYSSPDGQWSLSVKDGLWLESDGQPAILISQEPASNVIWCPDSTCFFFSVLRNNHLSLYRVSLPDRIITTIDEASFGGYQWLGVKP